MKIFKQIKNNRGFTLIETMVAIFILSLALVALLTLLANSLYISRYNRNEITANYLLQEVIDTIKNNKSSYMLKALNNPTTPVPSTGLGSTNDKNITTVDHWGDFVDEYSDCGENSPGCEIDAKTGEVTACEDTDNCGYLYYDKDAITNGAYYYYDQSADPKSSYFKRTIKITENPDNTIPELRIEVTISWVNGSQEMPTKTLTTSLLPWEI